MHHSRLQHWGKEILSKRGICKKCNYVQSKNWSIYHRCSNCGSLDLEMKTEEEIKKMVQPITVIH
jgi:Zn finger protein HypA/HybF involved in hydrogenase expression